MIKRRKNKKIFFYLILSSLPYLSFNVKTFHFAQPQEALQVLGERSFQINKEMVAMLKEINSSLDQLPEDYRVLEAQKEIHEEILKELDHQIFLKDESLKLADENVKLLRESVKIQEEIYQLQKELLTLQEKSLAFSQKGLEKTRALLEIGKKSMELGEKSAALSEEMVKALKAAFGLK